MQVFILQVKFVGYQLLGNYSYSLMNIWVITVCICFCLPFNLPLQRFPGIVFLIAKKYMPQDPGPVRSFQEFPHLLLLDKLEILQNPNKVIIFLIFFSLIQYSTDHGSQSRMNNSSTIWNYATNYIYFFIYLPAFPHFWNKYHYNVYNYKNSVPFILSMADQYTFLHNRVLWYLPTIFFRKPVEYIK